MSVTISGSGQTVVQVTQSIYTGAATITPGGYAFADSGLSASLTLVNPNNKILIVVTLNARSNNYCAARIVQSINGAAYTVAPNSVVAGSYGGCHIAGLYNSGNGGGGTPGVNAGFSLLVTPGVSVTTYAAKVQVSCNSGGSWYMNQQSTSDMGAGPCTLTLMEVSAA